MTGPVRTPEPDASGVVAKLRRIVGAKLTAYLGNAHDTSTVRGWVDGSSELPDQRILDRLEIALSVAQVLSARENPNVVQSWFRGRNPALDDRPPAQVLREDDSAQARRAVEHAAREFAAHGFNG